MENYFHNFVNSFETIDIKWDVLCFITLQVLKYVFPHKLNKSMSHCTAKFRIKSWYLQFWKFLNQIIKYKFTRIHLFNLLQWMYSCSHYFIYIYFTYFIMYCLTYFELTTAGTVLFKKYTCYSTRNGYFNSSINWRIYLFYLKKILNYTEMLYETGIFGMFKPNCVFAYFLKYMAAWRYKLKVLNHVSS